MKKCFLILVVLVYSLTVFEVNAQFRNKHEIKIEYSDFDKLYNKHDFYGEIYRYNKKDVSDKSLIHKVERGTFPKNGLILNVNLFKNESLELKFYLSRKGHDNKIDTYHETISTEDLELDQTVTFSFTTNEWNEKSYSTQEFMTFLASMIQTREQEAVMDVGLHSKLTSLPLGSFVFIDKENPNDIKKFVLPEFSTAEIDSSIPKSALLMKYSKVIHKEKNGSIHASFSRNKIMASIQSVVESSDFVELNMNLDKYHKRYVKNIGAIHLKYLTEDESKLDEWFKDKIETINSADDRTRYELHFTSGHKLIDELKITYNSYKNFSKQIDVDLELFDIVTANAGGKMIRYKSTKDTLVASNYLVDVETENLSNTLYRLANYYKLKEEVSNKVTLLRSQLEYSQTALKNNIKLFEANYNEFLNQYEGKNLPINEDFSTVNCSDSNCVTKILMISILMKKYDIDIASYIYELFLKEKYDFLKEDERKTKLIINSQNILKYKFYLIKDIASEVVASYAAIKYINSQLNYDNPLSFSSYVKELVNSEDYRSGTPLAKFILEAL